MRRKDGRTFLIHAGGQDQLQNLLVRSAIRAVVYTAQDLWRWFLERIRQAPARTPSIRASNCLIVSPRATTDHCDRRISRLHFVQERGAEVEFVAPPEGLLQLRWSSAWSAKHHTPRRQSYSSIGRCRNAAKLGTRTMRIWYYGSLRTDAPPMPTGVKLSDFKLLFPSDLAEYTRKVHVL